MTGEHADAVDAVGADVVDAEAGHDNADSVAVEASQLDEWDEDEGS